MNLGYARVSTLDQNLGFASASPQKRRALCVESRLRWLRRLERCAEGTEFLGEPSLLAVEQVSRVDEIGRIKALCEPVVHFGENAAGLVALIFAVGYTI